VGSPGTQSPSRTPEVPAVSNRTRALTPAPAPESTSSAPRLHIEQGTDGAIVWLGLDGDAAAIAARAAALCAELRRSFPGTQQRLALVVCNGHAIYSSNTTPRKETV
jgi:hypothetical protein